MAHTPIPVSAVNKQQGKKGKRAVAAATFSRKGDSAGGAPQGRPRRTNFQMGSGAPKARATSPMTK
eukprot:5207605-Pleurochrysis_carterae.AAC.1